MFRQLMAKKPLELVLKEAALEHRLHRVLGPVSLTALGVGAIIGAGIFVATGRVAREDAGPAVIISYAVAGFGCALAALCYAEFASMVPVAGSAYTYAYVTLGELVAWIVGWDLILEYALSGATVASGWSGHLDEFLQAAFGCRVPPIIASDPFSTTGAWINLPAMLILAAITGVLVIGIRQSALTNAVLVLVKLLVIFLALAVGLYWVQPSNWTSIPVAPAPGSAAANAKWGLIGFFGGQSWLAPLDESVRSSFAPYGFSGIMVGAAIVFFSYIGFDSISTHSEEARCPQRDVPLGILISLVVCTLLYIAVSALITGMVPYPAINSRAAVAAAFTDLASSQQSLFLRTVAILISAGALAGITSVLLVTFLSQARIFLAMARDRLLPHSFFGTVHPRYRTPHRATILTGALVALAAGFTPMNQLQNMVNIGTLLAFVIVAIAVLVLRIRQPNARRPFRCPAVWCVAPLAVLVNLIVMLFLPVETWVRLLVWLGIGFLIYFCHGRFQSALYRADSRTGSPTLGRAEEAAGVAQ